MGRDHREGWGGGVAGEKEGMGLCSGAGPFLEVEKDPAKPTAKPESLGSGEPGGKSFQTRGVSSCVGGVSGRDAQSLGAAL